MNADRNTETAAAARLGAAFGRVMKRAQPADMAADNFVKRCAELWPGAEVIRIGDKQVIKREPTR